MWSILQLVFCCVTIATIIPLASAGDDSFFTSVVVRDAESKSGRSQSPTHWFQIEAEMFLIKGQDKDVFLSIPKDFTGLPTGPFELKHKSRAVGKVMVSEEHVLQVSLPVPPRDNMTASFQLKAKLKPDAAESIEAPQVVSYDFYSSQGENFKQLIRFEPRSLDEMIVDGGVFRNKTAWFVVDVPVEQLDEPVYIFSDPGEGSHESQHEIIKDMTRCELVTAVDSFHRPKVTEPITPTEDHISDSSMFMKFKHDLQGYYVRIWYYNKPKILETSKAIRVQTGIYKRAPKGLHKIAMY